MIHEQMKALIAWYLGALNDGGYWLVAALMAAESSIVPIPSEVIIPPAVMAAKEGRLTIAGIIIAGTIGSWVGATIMYWVSRYAGRPLLLKYGRYVFITPKKIESIENWTLHFGPFGIFAARLLPVVRHLIGIPAGIVQMNFLLYSLYTIIGSAIWTSVLCWVGFQAGKDTELLQGSLHKIMIWIIGGLFVLGVIYWFFVHRVLKKNAASKAV
jgi:membrane protein DedA with SNARE-associated domain